MQMAAMGRVERAAEEPDAQMPAALRPALGAVAAPAVLRPALGEAVQGRTWPLPRTRYL
jgi:hypothetical protein